MAENYVGIIAKIKQVVENMGIEGVKFFYLSMYQANVTLDRVDGKVIVVETPDFGQLVPKSLRVCDKVTFRVWFLQPRKHADNDAMANENEVNEMKILAAQFVKALRESGLFETKSLFEPMQYVYELSIFNRAETGIGLDMTLQELDGVKIC